jgi:hypothetical protein
MEPDDVIKAFRKFSVVSNALSIAERNLALKLSAALQILQDSEVERMILDHSDEPMLACYISDGWARMIQSTTVTKLNVGNSYLRVTRRGRFRHEFLCQRGVFLCDPFDGTHLSHLLLSEPVGLKLGGRAVHVFTAACEFMSTLRQSGHRGLCWNVYLQDGLLHSILTRFFKARHELYYTRGPELGLHAQELHDTDLTVTIRCSSHSCSNSLGHGLKVVSKKDFLVDELHIVTASYLNAASQLYTDLDDWLSLRLRFETQPTGTIKQRRAFWSHFCDNFDIVELLVASDIRSEGGFVVAANWVSTLMEPHDTIAGLLRYLYRWKKFIETRWCGSKESSILLLRSLAAGAECLALDSLEHAPVQHMHLGGIRRASPQVKLLAVVAAFAGGPADALLHALFEDDRLLLRAVEYRSILDDGLRYLCELDMYIWKRVSAIISPDFDVREVIHLTFKASLISCAYMWFMLFKQLLFSPLSLTQGDIVSNVAALAVGIQSGLEDVSARLNRAIVTHGVTEAHVVRHLKLLSKTPCTVNLVEQAHGIGAVIMKLHEQLEELSLRALAHLGSAKALVSPSRLDVKLTKLEVQISKLEHRSVTGVHGKNMFAHENAARLYANLSNDGLTRGQLQSLRNKVVNDAFEALPPERRRYYVSAAAVETRLRNSEVGKEMQSCRNLMDLDKDREAAEVAELGTTTHMTAAKLSASQVQRLCDIVLGLEGRLSELQNRQTLAPAAISEKEVALLEQTAVALMPAKSPPPEWLGHVVMNRDALIDTAFFTDAAPCMACGLLYASQNPRFALFIRLDRVAVTLPAFETMSPLEVLELDCFHRREFAYTQPFEFACDRLVPFSRTCDFNVLYGLQYYATGAHTRGSSQTFAQFRADCTYSKLTESSSPKAKKPRVDKAGFEAALRAELPWLTEADIQKALGKKIKRPSWAEPKVDGDASSSSNEDPLGPVEDEGAVVEDVVPVDDGDFGSAVEELEALRDEFDVDVAADYAFRSRIMGGPDTKKRLGVAASGQKGSVRTQFARNWCDCYNWPKEKNYFFSIYGHAGATNLVQEYCRRSNYYFNLWESSVDVDYVFTDEDFIGDDPLFFNWAFALDPRDACYLAAMTLRAYFPQQ